MRVRVSARALAREADTGNDLVVAATATTPLNPERAMSRQIRQSGLQRSPLLQDAHEC